MKIDSDLISGLEQLAAIRLKAESKAKLSRQLEAIVGFFEVINRADTTALPAEAGTEDHMAASLRPDGISPGLDHDEVMAAAPEAANGFFKVPKIIDSE